MASNPINEEKIKEQLELAKKAFDAAVENYREQLKATHTKKEFTFTLVEKRRLVEMQMVEMVAHQAIDDIVNLEAIKRVGYDLDPEIKSMYDVNTGRFILFVPKEKSES